jgi:hypothetical protein
MASLRRQSGKEKPKSHRNGCGDESRVGKGFEAEKQNGCNNQSDCASDAIHHRRQQKDEDNKETAQRVRVEASGKKHEQAKQRCYRRDGQGPKKHLLPGIFKFLDGCWLRHLEVI